jgi:hypothetical protein
LTRARNLSCNFHAFCLNNVAATRRCFHASKNSRRILPTNFAHLRLFPRENISKVQYFQEVHQKEIELGKFPAYNSSSVERDHFPAMKLHAIRSVSALALAALLAACGGGQVDQPTQTAAAISSSQMGSAASVASVATVATVATSTMPAPDCAADGCKGLRIIDANAEAYRYEAMRRAAAEEAAGNTNT